MTRHHFTVDVEEHFQVSAFADSVPRRDWDLHESRVAANVTGLLDLLDRSDARGTFFVLGCVAERHPDMIRGIASAGHEVASHGWGHERATELSEAEFREDVRDSKQLLEDLVGEAVLGYRAPSFSIVPGWEWALDVLIEEGPTERLRIP
jgi:polysaccharide deacetylase family protein (PEP-CTERM system associated)